MMKLDVFGKMDIEIIKREGEWTAYRCGAEGKKRKLHELKIPNHIPESEVMDYVADIYHEWASPQNSVVVRIDRQGTDK